VTCTLYIGDALTVLRTLPAGSAQTCVTSPPYWGLRNYGQGQLGAEKTPEEYVAKLVEIFADVRRVLSPSGTLWLNLGDTFINAKGQSHGKDPKNKARRFGLRPNDVKVPGYKRKDLVGIPWMVAMALRNDGWFLRSDIVWAKPKPTPDPVADRPARAHEFIFLLSKSIRYLCDASTLPERSVWTFPSPSSKGAYSGAFPEELPRRCIVAGSRPGSVVLDPFFGSGTTGVVAATLDRDFIGIDLNPACRTIAESRLAPVPVQKAV
jgi:site-specific DNA-methyltransferase (adenine-specific)